MKKLSIILATIALFSITNQAMSAVIQYSDELPADYIKNYQTSKKMDYKQSLPIYNEEKRLEVAISSPQRITLRPLAVVEDGKIVLKNSHNVDTKLTFTVSKDVMKNGVLYIKQGTEAIGIIRNANVSRGILAAPDEIQVSMFTTKDVKGKEVKLYGTVLSEGKDLGYFSSFGIPSCKATIPKGKIYTLYAEK